MSERITLDEMDSERGRLEVASCAQIMRARDRAGITDEEMARRVGCPDGEVVRDILDGEKHLTMRWLACLGLACGVRWRVVALDAKTGDPIELEPDAGYRAREAEVERLRAAFAHVHVTCRDGLSSDGDECVECGLDIRDEIHRKENVLAAHERRNERIKRLAALRGDAEPIEERAP